ncbi:MAG: TldD/PmbA family protein [archaeon YNP-WB-062]|nr:TldD/PmbA family protein [Candidatus Culexarchaeum yellowstonense]
MNATMSSPFEIAEKAVRITCNMGANEAEAYVERSKVLEVFLERNDFKTVRVKWHAGIGIRAIYNKKVGFSYASSLTSSSVEEVCREAFKNAKLSPELKDWVSLPSPMPLPKVEGTFCNEIANISESQLVDLAKRGYEAIFEADRRARCDDGKISAVVEETVIANSNDILVGEEGTAISGYIVCVASEAGKTSSFASSSGNARMLSQFKPEDIGREAALLAVRSLNPRKIGSFKGKVLLEWMPVTSIILPVIGFSVNADMVQRRSSLWAGKIGEKVCSSNISIVDDGTLPGGMATSRFDDEGVARRVTPIISNGVLKSYLYDSYTAFKESRESTGNAGRASYASMPSISFSNVIFNEGSKSIDELISEVDRGLLVGRFSGNVESASGIFSGTVKQSVYIENGEVKFAVEETMISGNVFQLLSGNVVLGKPRRMLGGAHVPPILLEDVNIISKT